MIKRNEEPVALGKAVRTKILSISIGEMQL